MKITIYIPEILFDGNGIHIDESKVEVRYETYPNESSALQVKVWLLKKQLSIAQIARELCDDSHSEQALRVMLSQMINGRRFYPTLAQRLKDRYNLSLSRPAKTQHRRAA